MGPRSQLPLEGSGDAYIPSRICNITQHHKPQKRDTHAKDGATGSGTSPKGSLDVTPRKGCAAGQGRVFEPSRMTQRTDRSIPEEERRSDTLKAPAVLK